MGFRTTLRDGDARLESGKLDCLCGLWRSRGQCSHEWVSRELQDWRCSNAAWPLPERHCWCWRGGHFGLDVMNAPVLMLQAHPRLYCVWKCFSAARVQFDGWAKWADTPLFPLLVLRGRLEQVEVILPGSGERYLPVFAQGFGVSYEHQGCFSSQALLLQTVVLCVSEKNTFPGF